jgi:hypothetical protein
MAYRSQVILAITKSFDETLTHDVALVMAETPDLGQGICSLFRRAERLYTSRPGIVLYFWDWTPWDEEYDDAVKRLLALLSAYPSEAYAYHCLGEEEGDYRVSGLLNEEPFHIRLVRYLAFERI